MICAQIFLYIANPHKCQKTATIFNHRMNDCDIYNLLTSMLRVATMLDNALYDKKSQISHGQYKTLQATFYPNGYLVDIGIIGKNRNTPNVFIKNRI